MAETPPVDPDVGPTRKTPSVSEGMDRAELQTRLMKLKHMQTQQKLVDEANEMSKHDPEEG